MVALTALVSLISKSNNLKVVTLIYYFQMNIVLRIDAETTLSLPRAQGAVRSRGENTVTRFISAMGIISFIQSLTIRRCGLKIWDLSQSSPMRPPPASTPLFKLPSMAFPAKVGLVISQSVPVGSGTRIESLQYLCS